MSVDLWHGIKPGEEIAEKMNVIVEIPKGSNNKYELDKKTGLVKLDRVLFSSVFYPGDYGIIPQTLAEDGDPADGLVLVTNPTFPGVLIEARPIGVLKMIDGGDPDDKILFVPTEDPRFAKVFDLEDVPEHTLKEISEFFRTYKNLQNKKVEIAGWKGASEAKKVIEESIKLYKKKFDKK